MNKVKTGLFLISATAIYTSCNKDDSALNPDPVTLDSASIMGFKDSTQLVKSYTVNEIDSNGVVRPGSTYYIFYDTLQRKITMESDPNEGVSPEYAFSYNKKGLLIKYVDLIVIDRDPTELNGFIKTIDYTYDGFDILKTGTFIFANGNKIVYSMTKTLHPNRNYQLSWETPPGPVVELPGNINSVNFDKDGNLLSYYDKLTESLNSVDYDNNGNINKMVATFYTLSDNSKDSTMITLFEFNGRDTKGSQFHNFFQILCKGVSNFPAETVSLNQLIPFQINTQYFKYPAYSTNINIPEPGAHYCPGCPVRTVNYNNVPIFDSQNRLLSYRVFLYSYNYRYSFSKIHGNEIIFSYYK